MARAIFRLRACLLNFAACLAEARRRRMVKLAKDQVEDYTLRKDQWLEVSEKWLAPYLDYEPTP